MNIRKAAARTAHIHVAAFTVIYYKVDNRIS